MFRDRDKERKRRRSKSRDRDRKRDRKDRDKKERLEYIKTDDGGEVRIKEEPMDGRNLKFQPLVSYLFSYISWLVSNPMQLVCDTWHTLLPPITNARIVLLDHINLK